MLLHLLVIASCITMVLLGRWQWTAAHRHHGDVRNYAYAFQWWAFTGFALLMWWRVVQDYLAPAQDGLTEEETVPAEVEASQYVAYVVPPPQSDDDDPERASFNAYLADLARRDSSIPDREESH